MADSTGETMLINPAPKKPTYLTHAEAAGTPPKRQTRMYQAELTALQNRVDLAIVLLRGFVADPKKGPMRVEIALETLIGTPPNGAAPKE